jgi:hypothetical protein
MREKIPTSGVGRGNRLGERIRETFAIGMKVDDRFGECIRRIVEGERDWPSAAGNDASEIEARRQELAQELFEGAELVDLVGHSTPIKCCLKLGDWVLDSVAAERLASFLPGSVQIVRLIGCCTASTEEGRAAVAAFTQRCREAYGTLNKVYSTHFSKNGLKKGIGAPPMRGFFPAASALDPHPPLRGAREEQRSRGLLVWSGRRPWKAILRLYRRIRRLLPSREDPRPRILGLLHPEITSMPGLLTEPLLVFKVTSRSVTWTLEILFDFEHARFYASLGAAEDRDLTYQIRGFGQVAKTPLEAYLERGPRGVTLIDRHEEAGDRCDAARPLGKRVRDAFIAGAAAVALVLLALSIYYILDAPLRSEPLPPVAGGLGPLIDAPIDSAIDAGPVDASVDASVDAPVDASVDAPVDASVDAPVSASVAGSKPAEPPSCATLTPIATYTGFVAGYTSPEAYGSAMCPRSLSIQINRYSRLYLGVGDMPGGTFVSWAGGRLTRKSACEAARVRADLYRQISNEWKLVDTKQSHGVWEDSPGAGSCRLPGVVWRNTHDSPDVLSESSNYRIVATARTSATGPTRRFRVFSERDQWVR